MLSPYTVTIYTKQDNPYNVIPDAPIEIRERLANGTSGSLSIIYSDQEGLIPITQTGAKADSNGQFTFYAEAAQYNAIYESQTVPVDTGLTAGALPSAMINDLSLTYVFDTASQMTSAAINFPTGKRLYVIDTNANYKVTVGASPNVGNPDLVGGGYAALIDEENIRADQWGFVPGLVSVDTYKALLTESQATGKDIFFPAGTYDFDGQDVMNGGLSNGQDVGSVRAIGVRGLTNFINIASTNYSGFIKFHNINFTNGIQPVYMTGNIADIDITGCTFTGCRRDIYHNDTTH